MTTTLTDTWTRDTSWAGPALPPADDDVQYALTEEQQMLRDSTRGLLADACGMPRVREVMAADGVDVDLWERALDMGWTGMAIAEAHGGSGYGLAELAVIFEECGRVVAPIPLLPTVGLAAPLLEALGGETAHGLLRAIAVDGRRVAVAHRDAPHADARTAPAVEVRDGALHGRARFVLDGVGADDLLVLARDGDDVVLVCVDGGANGLARTAMPALDPTRPIAELTFSGATGATLGRGEDVVAALEAGIRTARALLAAEAVGGARAAFEMALEYARTRMQFGRPIGSFQAIKHILADMLVAVESAHSAAAYAVRVGDQPDFAVAAPLAKDVCTNAALEITGASIQVHGGIGFTWEHDAHLYFKRAKGSTLTLGSPSEVRDDLGHALGV